MKNKILGVILIVFLITSVYFSFVFFKYLYRQNQNKSMISYCKQDNSPDCYVRMIELLLPDLLIYDAKVDGKELELIKMDDKYLRVDAKAALEKSDALLGYGVFWNTFYEERYSALFDKFSYTFDCGIPSFHPNHPKCLFFSECISSDEFLIGDQKSSGNVHSLKNKLKELGLSDKKVFIKMDISGSEVLAIPELIENADNITGFFLSFYVHSPAEIISKIHLLKELNEKFVLVTREFAPPIHTNTWDSTLKSDYYTILPNVRNYSLKLSFINKKLLSDYKISLSQNTEKYYEKKNIRQSYIDKIKGNDYSVSDIHYVVVLVQKLKNIRKEVGIL